MLLYDLDRRMVDRCGVYRQFANKGPSFVSKRAALVQDLNRLLRRGVIILFVWVRLEHCLETYRMDAVEGASRGGRSQELVSCSFKPSKVHKLDAHLNLKSIYLSTPTLRCCSATASKQDLGFSFQLFRAFAQRVFHSSPPPPVTSSWISTPCTSPTLLRNPAHSLPTPSPAHDVDRL